MARPIKRKSSFKIKVQRRDIARAEQKKLMAEWRKNFESGKMPTIGETFFSTTIMRSRSVRSLATINNLGGSMAKRRHQIVRAGKATLIASDDITSYYPKERKPISGNRRTKYNRKHFPRRIEDIDYLAVLNRSDLQPTSDVMRRWNESFLTGKEAGAVFDVPDVGPTAWFSTAMGKAIADRQQVKGNIVSGERPMPTPEQMDQMRIGPQYSFREKMEASGVPLFSNPITRGYASGIKALFDNITNVGNQEVFRTRRLVLDNIAKGMSTTEAFERALATVEPEVQNFLKARFFAPEVNGTEIDSELFKKPINEGYGYGVAVNLAMMATPEVSEEGTFINQRQADTIGEVKKSLDDKRPLPITRGHYGDLMAASQYPGMKKIADELFKNGVEFIEASDPRAKMADYSVCFMYPHTITALDISKDVTQGEVDKFKPFDDIANWPSLDDRLQQLRLNSLKHLDPSAVVKNVQQWIDDGTQNKEEGKDNENQD